MTFARFGMFTAMASLVLSPFLQAADFGEPEKLTLAFSAYEGDSLQLKGIDARRQLVVTGI